MQYLMCLMASFFDLFERDFDEFQKDEIFLHFYQHLSHALRTTMRPGHSHLSFTWKKTRVDRTDTAYSYL